MESGSASGSQADPTLAVPLDGLPGERRPPDGQARHVRTRSPGQPDVDRTEVTCRGLQQRQCDPRDLVDVLHVGQTVGEPAEQRDAAAGDHLGGGLRRDVHHALDRAGGSADRRVGEGEVALLQEAAAVQGDGLVLDPGGSPPGHDRLHHRPDQVPGLREDLVRRPSEGARVLVGDQRHVRLVVDESELRSPEERDREARVGHDVDDAEQRLVPLRDVTERCGPPVDRLVDLRQRPEAAEQCAHVAR